MHPEDEPGSPVWDYDPGMSDPRWLIFGLIAALGGAGVWLFTSVGLKETDVTLATTLRGMIMAAMLVAVAGATGKLGAMWSGELRVSGREWGYIALGAVCGAGSWLAGFAALKLGVPGPVAAVDRLSVVFVFVLGAVLLGERHGWRGWGGLLLVIVGVYLIAFEKKA